MDPTSTSVDRLETVETEPRHRELRKRGIAAQEAAKTAGSSDGPWHLAKTPALNIALPNAYFVSLGLFPSSRFLVSSTRRTAGCGPRIVRCVWQGRVGDHSPYADCLPAASSARLKLLEYDFQLQLHARNAPLRQSPGNTRR